MDRERVSEFEADAQYMSQEMKEEYIKSIKRMISGYWMMVVMLSILFFGNVCVVLIDFQLYNGGIALLLLVSLLHYSKRLNEEIVILRIFKESRQDKVKNEL